MGKLIVVLLVVLVVAGLCAMEWSAWQECLRINDGSFFYCLRILSN